MTAVPAAPIRQRIGLLAAVAVTELLGYKSTFRMSKTPVRLEPMINCP